MKVSLTGAHKKEKKCKTKVICEIKDIEKKKKRERTVTWVEDRLSGTS